MSVFGELLNLLTATMETPTSYGFFHLFFFALSIMAGIVLYRLFPNADEKQARGILIVSSLLIFVLEIYKQIVFTFSYDGQTITADYQWYIFPFQFCSTPMYVGALAALTKGRVHHACCAYLATYSIFAGLCVMLYPDQVFIDTIGVNLQTMICHGAMISIGIWLMLSGYVKTTHKTMWRAVPVFASCVVIAILLNEVAHRTDFVNGETFNMFYFSPYCDPSLPVYSLVQQAVTYPWCLLIYVAVFTLAAFVVFWLFWGIKRMIKR